LVEKITEKIFSVFSGQSQSFLEGKRRPPPLAEKNRAKSGHRRKEWGNPLFQLMVTGINPAKRPTREYFRVMMRWDQKIQCNQEMNNGFLLCMTQCHFFAGSKFHSIFTPGLLLVAHL
jgi:hypothetical protein